MPWFSCLIHKAFKGTSCFLCSFPLQTSLTINIMWMMQWIRLMLHFILEELYFCNTIQPASSSVLMLSQFPFFVTCWRWMTSDYGSTSITELLCWMCFIWTIYESEFIEKDRTKSLVIRFEDIVILQTWKDT